VSTLPWRFDAEMALQTRYMLQHNMVSIMYGFEENISEKLSQFIHVHLNKLLHAH